jgi:DNA-binding NarL/FixJ family response regulator
MQLERSVLMVRPGRLLDALGALFEAIWSSATPVSSPSPPAGPLDEHDRAVLSLLVAGLTDDAVGARLGMSRRTVARRVQRLMSETGAHSRLQLGWWARERNWLP